jgi:predicted permease
MAPMNALKEQGQGGGSADTRTSVSGGLVVAQVALSLVLLVAAGLLIRTFDRLTNVPLGFDDDRVLLINVDTARAGIDPAGRNQLFHELVGAVARVPAVAAAAGSFWTPGSGAFNLIVDARGRASSDERRVIANFVTPGWFETFGIPIRAGRDISERDTPNALPVVIVNEAFVHRALPNREAVGETLGDSDSEILRGRTVIGVVGDAMYGSLRDPAPPTTYIPLAQSVGLEPPGRTTITVSVRPVTGPPASVASAAGAALMATNRNVAFSFRTLADQMNASIGQERLAAMLSGLFAVLALVLAGVGLYGLTAYTVSRRRSEIGIRIALGARGADVIRLILRRSLWLTGIGIVLGLAGAVFVTRYLEAMLFGVMPMDPWTLAAVSLMFATVATIAAFLPARRAARTDPSLALRCE